MAPGPFVPGGRTQRLPTIRDSVCHVAHGGRPARRQALSRRPVPCGSSLLDRIVSTSRERSGRPVFLAIVVSVGLIVVAVRFTRRGRTLVVLPPSDTISTMHMELSKRRTARTRAALDAATLELR